MSCRSDFTPPRCPVKIVKKLTISAGADGKGVLLTGDTIQVVSDRHFVSFMYSYPNLIPLPAREVRRIVATVAPYAYDRIYGAWWDRVVRGGAKTAVSRSADRYIQALQGDI